MGLRIEIDGNSFTRSYSGKLVSDDGTIRKMFNVPIDNFKEKQWESLTELFEKIGNKNVSDIVIYNSKFIPNLKIFKFIFSKKYKIHLK